MLNDALDLIRGKRSASLADLRAAFAGLDVEGAEHEAARLDAERRRLLLDGTDKDIIKAEESVRLARVNAERTRAAIGELTRRIADAERIEAEAARRKRYAAARKQGDEAAKELAATYPEIATRALALLRLVAEAEVAIEAANSDLPADAPPLPSPEFAVRGIPGAAREVIREQEVTLWCALGSHEPAPDEFQQLIIPDGEGRGYRSLPGGVQRYVRRRFVRMEFHPPVRPLFPRPLYDELSLPALTVDGTAFWRAGVMASHRSVLQHLGHAESAPSLVTAPAAPRAVHVEHRPVDPLTTPAADALPRVPRHAAPVRAA